MKQFLSSILESGTPKQRKQKAFAVTAIAITAALIVIALVTLCALAIADAFSTPAPLGEGGGGNADGAGRDLVTTTFEENQLYSGNLIVSNDTYALQSEVSLELLNDKRPRDPETNSPYYSIMGWTTLSATPEMSEAFHAMFGDFYEQYANAEKNPAKELIVAKAAGNGDPLYENGLTLSLEYYVYYNSGNDNEVASIATAADYAWLRTNAYKYGFVLAQELVAPTEGVEPEYILRYVGLEHAALAKEAKCETLEAYLTYLRENTSVSKTKSVSVSVKGADGRTSKVSYKIFYQPQDAETFYTADPNKYTATVSGDNMTGYIVSYCPIAK